MSLLVSIKIGYLAGLSLILIIYVIFVFERKNSIKISTEASSADIKASSLAR